MRRRPRFRHWIELGLVRMAGAIDRLLGPRLSGALAAAAGRAAYRLGIRAGVVDAQLRAAFPDRDDAWRKRVARSSYEHLGREAMAILRLARQGPEDVLAGVDVTGLEMLEEGLARGRGAVIVTGHFGNWEVAGAFVAARVHPLDVVARRQNNPLVDRLMRETRERLGMRVIYVGGATDAVLESLQAGRPVALVADQDARQRGVFVPFFGRPASTHRGPALLALRAGAPIYVGAAIRRPEGGYRIRVLHVPVPESAGEAAVEELTATIAAALEAAVREAPEQYLWQHRRWKTAPPERDGGAVGYEPPGDDGKDEASSK